MHEVKEIKISFFIAILIAFILLFKPLNSLSFIMGYSGFLLYYYALCKRVDLILEIQDTNKFTLILLSVINIFILIIPMLICFIYNKYLNFMYCFLGLILNKVVLYFKTLFLKN